MKKVKIWYIRARSANDDIEIGPFMTRELAVTCANEDPVWPTLYKGRSDFPDLLIKSKFVLMTETERKSLWDIQNPSLKESQ